MKLNPFLPRYAVPTAPLLAFVLRDILIGAVLLGCILFGIYVEHRVSSYRIAQLENVIQIQREQLAGKATADGLAHKARKAERP